MDNIKSLIILLPRFEDITELLRNDAEASYILQKAIKVLEMYMFENIQNADDREESAFLVEALVDKSCERIYTGSFAEVPLEIRQTYTLACYLNIVFLLLESTERKQIERCIQVLDEAILLGSMQNIFPKCNEFKDLLVKFFDTELDPSVELKLPIIEIVERCTVKCDILQLNQPSILEFQEKCFNTLQPALLLDTFNNWPALEKWRDLNYILKLTGNRKVPIEIGANYASDGWSQKFMKIKDFLKRQFTKSIDNIDEEYGIEYLAQHELFEQIPQLKSDFFIPDYCSLGKNLDSLDIKAWLGPKGTISQMHYDPKHNLLCQVFGSKIIILASPDDTEHLYVNELLKNTSQINANYLDFDKFPLATNVKFLYLTLQPGDCLYLPPKWWHYVESMSSSFSVSFWWE